MKDAILAIDQGTTGSTALFIDKEVNVIAQANCEFPNHYPKPGWVEHDVAEIWSSIVQAIQAAKEKTGESRKKCFSSRICKSCVFSS